ncbi:hypothetical protein PUN28_015628 [Cardiocondyla obscurior]|uniref:Uncharacterized protein n=1 Tax=Cardiocondyla obscurior TaxID=286306 RepID=A0AAW2EXM8_9HYME
MLDFRADPRRRRRHAMPKATKRLTCYLCAEGWLDTSHLRGGAGSGWASCIGGATFSHRQNYNSAEAHADW